MNKRVSITNVLEARDYLREASPETLDLFGDRETRDVTRTCKRCGGFGWYPTKQHGACFECGGQGSRWTETLSLIDEAKRVRRQELAKRRRERKADEAKAKAKAFVSSDHELREALKLKHRITEDLVASLNKNGELSESQVKLAKDLVSQQNRRNAENALLVEAEIEDGRQTVAGEVVSVKLAESMYGHSWKMTVKVTTDGGGHWLAWGSIPSGLWDAALEEACVRLLRSDWGRSSSDDPYIRIGEDDRVAKALRGRRVIFDAKLKRGREKHFALWSRPTKPTLVRENF